MKTAIFFDGSNFYRAMSRTDMGLRVDYNRLADWVRATVYGDTLVRAEYHISVDDDIAPTINKFLSGLALQPGYFVYRHPRVTRFTTCRNCSDKVHYTIEKQVDTFITASMIKLAAVNAYDIAVIVSGDQDFIPAIEAVTSFGKIVWVATWGDDELSSQVRQHCYGHIKIREGINEFRVPERLPTSSGIPMREVSNDGP
jgi:uncharacterized LabA/DUF88 family protein